MTDDQRKKYEEAARDWSYNILVDQRRLHPQDLRDAYFEGCTFASQDTEERVKQLQDENKRLREALSRSAQYISSLTDNRIVEIGQNIVSEVRQLLNL